MNGTNKQKILNFDFLKMLSINEHCSLLDSFVNYKENEVMWIWLQEHTQQALLGKLLGKIQ
jgi:hypothetical protein